MTARLLNYVLYALGIIIAGTGFILEWKIPHGPAGKSVSLWGLSKHDWKDVHLWGGILLTLLVLWHLWLHRKWLTNVACKKNAGKLLTGLLLPVALIAAIAASPLGSLPSGQGGCSKGNCGSCSNSASCSNQESSCGSKSAKSCKNNKTKDACSRTKSAGSCKSLKGSGSTPQKAKSSGGCPSEGCNGCSK